MPVERNPLAKLLAAFIVTFGLLVTVDPVAPAVALAGELAIVRPAGLRYGRLLRQAWPVVLSAAGIVVVQMVFGTGPNPR